MKILLISGRNLELYSKDFLKNYDVSIIVSKAQISKIPENMKVFEATEKYDEISKTYAFKEEEARTIVNLVKPERIVCSQEACLMLAAKLRQEFNIPGLKPKDIMTFRSKILMKEKLAKAGLRVPYFAKDINQNYEDLKNKLKDGFIMKPIHSVGSRGIYRIFSEKDLESTRSEIGNCPYEAEEFIDGEFFHIDVCVQIKNVLFSGVSLYSCPTTDLQKGSNLGTICVTKNETFNKKASEFALKCIEALGFFDGVYHMEVFFREGEFIFLETAIRPVGLFGMVNYESFDVNLYDIDFKIQIGESLPVNICKNPSNRIKKSFMVFPKLTGLVKAFNIPEIKSKYKIEWNIKEGEKTEQTKTNIDFAGFLIFENINEDVLLKDFNYLKNEFSPILYE